MNTVVLYKSESGFTKKYAEWISEDLKCDCFNIDKFDLDNLEGYGTVIFGGGLFAKTIRGFKKIAGSKYFLNRRVIVFATGTSPEEENTIKEITGKNLSGIPEKKIKLFYFKGGMDVSKLKFFKRTFVKLMIKILKKKKSCTEEEKNMLEAFSKPVDYTSRDKIVPLIEFVRAAE